MFCTKCGAQLADGTKFCTQCGNQISNAAAPAPTPKTAPATPAPKTVTAAPKQKKKKNPAVLIICLVVVLLIGAAAAVYFTGIYEDIIDAVNDIFDKNEKDQDDDIFADEDEDEDEFEATDKTEDSETATTDAPATPDVPDTEETDDYGEAENEYEETVEPEPEVVIVCPECGTECSEEANFCIGCGYSFYGEPETDLSDMYSIWMTDCITKIADTYYTGTSIDVWQARTYKGGFIIGNTYFQHGLGLYSTENSTYTWEFSLPYSAKVLSFYYGIVETDNLFSLCLSDLPITSACFYRLP